MPRHTLLYILSHHACMRKYNDVFTLNDAELGEKSVVNHLIDTSTTQPMESPPRRLVLFIT